MKAHLKGLVSKLNGLVNCQGRKLQGRPYIKGTDLTLTELFRLAFRPEAIADLLRLKYGATDEELSATLGKLGRLTAAYFDRPFNEITAAGADTPRSRRPPLLVLDWVKAANLLVEKCPSEAWAGVPAYWQEQAVKIWEDGRPVLIPQREQWPRVCDREFGPVLVLGIPGYVPSVECWTTYKADDGWGGCWYWPRKALDIVYGRVPHTEVSRGH